MSELKRAVFAVAVFALSCSLASASGTPPVPEYRADTNWPKQLPHGWIMGQVGGVSIDSQDHVWVLQRPRYLTPDVLGAA